MAAPTLECLLEDFSFELGLFKGMLVPELFTNKIKHRRKSKEVNKDLEDGFSYLLNLEETQRCLTPTRVFSEKSDADADRLRDEGNRYYKKKNFEKALEHYNLSILAAPHPQEKTLNSKVLSSLLDDNKESCSVTNETDSEQLTKYKALAWGYSNRSAVLLLMKEYRKCLQDIELALQFTGSETIESKLMERKEKCLSSMSKDRVEDGCSNQQLVPPKLHHPNPALPSMSNAVKVAYTSTKGRHLVAVRNIRPGEIIGVEESSCNSLEPELLHSHCCVCLVKCNAPLPCPNCSMVIFCSPSCRQKGLQEDHSLECPILPSFTALDIQHRTLLAIKMLNRIPFAELKRLRSQLDKKANRIPKTKLGFNKDGVYCSKDYDALYHLVTNKDKRDITDLDKDMYSVCLIAIVLTKMLEQSGKYFVGEDGKPVIPNSEDLLITGVTLYTHLLQLELNFHLIFGKEVTGRKKEVRKLVGVGLFPTFSLMNHSCIPTTTSYSCGRSLVLMSLRSIPVGGEVTECYMSSYEDQLTPIRQIALRSEFHFVCTCEACEDDWPLFFLLPEVKFKCFKCQHPVHMRSLKCSNCFLDYHRTKSLGNEKSPVRNWWQNVLQVQEAEDKVKGIAMMMKLRKNLSEQDLSDICRFIELLEKYVSLPCDAMCQAQTILASAIHAKTM